MNLPHDLKFAERFIKPFVLTPDWFSLARIVAWFIVFLVALHFIVPSITPNLPHSKELAATNVIPLATTPSDPRYMRLDQSTVPDNSIIWVGGSSLAIKEGGKETYTFLPSKVDTNANQYLSIKMASRLLDTYTMTLDAIERKPKALFIVLNPFWVMNDKSSFFKTNMMNSGPDLWVNTNNWPLIPLLSSPGNYLWSLGGKHHKLIGNGYDYLKLIMPSKAKNKTKTSKQTSKKLSYNQPLLFWISQRYDTQTDFTTFDAKQWQIKAMEQNDKDNSAFAHKIFRNLLHQIKQSGIPTLLYLAPTDYSLTETPALSSYRAVQAQFNMISDEYKSSNIRIVRIPEDVYDSLVFTDYLHLSDSGKLPEFLKNEISAIIGHKEN